ncbi:MAG: hypothetical protein KGI27_10810 [Thaumarchaeota archaeon]|nr:hypothetical protein [Nitrososphaerota archaeon]
MSKDTKTSDWNSLWAEYTDLLKKWAQNLESLQKTSVEVQEKYKEVMSKAISESSQKTMKEFQDNWQKAMTQAGTAAFKQFGENWQKSISDSGLEQLKTYGDMMNKFAETWQKMWRQN